MLERASPLEVRDDVTQGRRAENGHTGDDARLSGVRRRHHQSADARRGALRRDGKCAANGSKRAVEPQLSEERAPAQQRVIQVPTCREQPHRDR